MVHESRVELRDYDGEARQIIVRVNGREKPTFLITNYFELPAELLVGSYARRWRVENGIAEAVKFFHLNALSSPILIKIHFDVIMNMIADTLYCRLAQQLRGFEDCDAPKIFRNFVKDGGSVEVRDGNINVKFSKRAHNPVLRAVTWSNLRQRIPWLNGTQICLSSSVERNWCTLIIAMVKDGTKIGDQTISYILIRIYCVLSARLAVCETLRMKTRLSKAKLRQDGSIEDIDFRHPRVRDKSLVLILSDDQWIIDYNILIITGPQVRVSPRVNSSWGLPLT
jgi:hypothetical protein